MGTINKRGSRNSFGEEDNDNSAYPEKLSDLVGTGGKFKRMNERAKLLCLPDKKGRNSGTADRRGGGFKWVNIMSENGEDGSNSPGKIDAGKRAEAWYERIEETTSKNVKRSRENKRLLLKVDYRTSWIFRIMLTLLAALFGNLYLQLF